DMVACYETIEHIGNPFLFIKELSRVLKQDGIMIVSCPNILWEPIHWIAAITNFHHSEGPHNFLKRNKLLNLFKRNNLLVLKENTTILLPFNKSIFIKMNEKLEEKMMENILRVLGLRRTFILKKI
ncbi:Methyltransferase type 11 domain protein, partial [Candidatus Magnetomorum sp. HK-1]